jgi:probable HAF family extracellular repeat protein
MKSTSLIRIVGTALVLALAIEAQEVQEAKQRGFAHYKVTDLGTLGGTYSAAFGMSSTGLVAGVSATPTQTGGPSATAFLWRHGHMINLGTLGGDNSGASVVNAEGEVALGSDTPILDPENEDFCANQTHHQCVAAIWKRGRLQALPLLVAGRNSQAYGINDRGQVSGFAEIDQEHAEGYCATPFQRFDFEAVIWEPNGEPKQLEPLPGDTVAFSWGINNKGQAIGGSGSCSDTVLPPNIPSSPHAVLWEKDGTPRDLGSLGTPPPGTPPLNIAGAINNRGDVVGGSLVEDGTVHQFLWARKAGMQDLGTFPGALATVFPCCNTINDSRQIAGFIIDQSGNSRAILWQNNEWMDLNDLIPKDSGWILQAAESINDAGQIAGYGLIDGNVHAFLLTPRDHERSCHDHDKLCGGENASSDR